MEIVNQFQVLLIVCYQLWYFEVLFRRLLILYYILYQDYY